MDTFDPQQRHCLQRTKRCLLLLYMAVSLCLAATISAEAGAPGSGAQQVVTVADAIRMTRWPWGAIWFSPDNTKVVVVLRKGNLDHNTNEYSLLLWQTEQVLQSPPPKLLLTMSSSSNRPAITDVTWLQNNDTLVFVGENADTFNQIYELNTRTGVLNQLTSQPTTKIGYSSTPDGQTIAYIANEPIKSLFDNATRREGVIVTSQPLSDLIAGQTGGDARFAGSSNQLFVRSDSSTRRINTTDKIVVDYTPFVSPDGKYVVVRTFVANVPPGWRRYADPRVLSWGAQRPAKGDSTWLQRFDIIDLSTGASRVLLDAPLRPGWDSEVAWAPDGRSVVITNTYLPLEGATGDEYKVRQSTRFAVQILVPSGRVLKISSEDLRLVGWEARTSRLVFLPGRLNWNYSAPKVFFEQRNDKWEKVSGSQSETPRSAITLEESANDPPKIIATDPATKRTALLLDLNPQFRDLRFGRVEEVHWRSPDGTEMKGGLYYPPDYSPGHRYPLVIQTHVYVPDHFFIDGPYTTAFAAQPLAGKGMIVLQVDEVSGHWDETVTHEEIVREVAVLDSAIDYLDRHGLIDLGRIGIVGFSRTCSDVARALVYSKHSFAAASLTAGQDGGYFGYVALSNASRGLGPFFETINGGLPWGDSYQLWQKRSPGFNAQKIRSPLRLVALDPKDLLLEWELFAALYRLEKPVEMVYIEDGEHVLERPWDRMVSQQGNVDWFAFWLKGDEDPDPAKSEQYARWRELRERKQLD